MNQETAWQAGRLGASRGPQRLLFGQMYEDVEIEVKAFHGKNRVFCIASAGATALRLAGEHEVVACDINPVQLAYAERRAHGSPAETGDAERAMNIARVFMPLVGWRRESVREFLAMNDVTKQSAYWKKYLDTRRFRAAFDLFLSPTTLRAIYAPRFLSFLPATFGAILRRRMARGFARHPNTTNPYARSLLMGEAKGEKTLPKMPRIQFVLSDAASYLESCAASSFAAFSLSNILDGAEPSYRSRLSQAVRRAATNDAVVVLRSFGEPPDELTANFAESDRAMLWGSVEVRVASLF